MNIYIYIYICLFPSQSQHKASEDEKKEAVAALSKYDALTDDEERRRYNTCVHTHTHTRLQGAYCSSRTACPKTCNTWSIH